MQTTNDEPHKTLAVAVNTGDQDMYFECCSPTPIYASSLEVVVQTDRMSGGVEARISICGDVVVIFVDGNAGLCLRSSMGIM